MCNINQLNYVKLTLAQELARLKLAFSDSLSQMDVIDIMDIKLMEIEL